MRQGRLLLPVLALLLQGCPADPLAGNAFKETEDRTVLTPLEKQRKEAKDASAVTIRLHRDDFTDLTTDPAVSGCAGDAVKYYRGLSGLGSAFETDLLDPNVTIRPSFIRNVAVDITNAGHKELMDPADNSKKLPNSRNACSILVGESLEDETGAIKPSNCARFDRPYVLEDLGAEEKGYDTGYYLLMDSQCANAGPIASEDPEYSKLLAGGVYLDLDRSALGKNEDLLLHLTFHPLTSNNFKPGNTAVSCSDPTVCQFDASEKPFFRVHLVKTGQSREAIQSVLQPRHLTYASTEAYPQVVQTLSVLAPPAGAPAQEQVRIPLSMDPGIDRIRIERYSGSAILISASLFRMGQR